LALLGVVGGWIPAGFTIAALLLIDGAIWFFVSRHKERKRQADEHAAAIEQEKRRWREEGPPPGPCTVLLTSVRDADERLHGFLLNLSENPAVDIPDAVHLIQRAEHIGKQPVVTDVEEDYAVALKIELEHRGARVRITSPSARRETGCASRSRSGCVMRCGDGTAGGVWTAGRVSGWSSTTSFR
jgi:hypothetical protein